MTSEITSEESEAVSKEVAEFVQSKEGTVLRSDKPVAKTLSYPIKKQGSGFFTVLEFQIEEDKIAELKEKLAKDSKILRNFLLIKPVEKVHKERRTRKKPAILEEIGKAKTETIKESSTSEKSEETQKIEEVKPSKKVELNDIEKKLDEILGE